jgi:hypothetical protein
VEPVVIYEVLESLSRKVNVSFSIKNRACFQGADNVGFSREKYIIPGNKACYKKVNEYTRVIAAGFGIHFLLRLKRVTFAVNYHELYIKD